MGDTEGTHRSHLSLDLHIRQQRKGDAVTKGLTDDIQRKKGLLYEEG